MRKACGEGVSARVSRAPKGFGTDSPPCPPLALRARPSREPRSPGRTAHPARPSRFVPQGLRDGQPTLPTPRASRSPVALTQAAHASRLPNALTLPLTGHANCLPRCAPTSRNDCCFKPGVLGGSYSRILALRCCNHSWHEAFFHLVIAKLARSVRSPADNRPSAGDCAGVECASCELNRL